MEDISNNSGLQHIIEAIFFNLNYIYLLKCENVCESWMRILTNTWFWFRSCVKNGRLKGSEKAWKKTIELTINTKLEENLIQHLKSVSLFSEFSPRSESRWISPILWAAKNGQVDIIKELLPLTDNPNAPDRYEGTPIYAAAVYGHSDIIELLAPYAHECGIDCGLGPYECECL